ncbi:hypothetical protein V5799_017784 [Amblyomma americanum]|uniref:Uncharacterized protein n=1 Tax=Amblyomma americanum TaxID=6943 RepID=A0AAQ4F171_AMBAM
MEDRYRLSAGTRRPLCTKVALHLFGSALPRPAVHLKPRKNRGRCAFVPSLDGRLFVPGSSSASDTSAARTAP